MSKLSSPQNVDMKSPSGSTVALYITYIWLKICGTTENILEKSTGNTISILGGMASLDIS